MWKTLLPILTLVIPQLSYAAVKKYQVNAQLYVDGKLMASPKVSTALDKSASVSTGVENSNDRMDFDVTVWDLDDESPEDNLLMSIDLEYVKGTTDVKASTMAIAAPGEETTIPVGKDGNVQLKLTAVPL